MIKTIIGRRNTGKTHLARYFIMGRSRPVIIVDLFNEFKGRRFFTARRLLAHMTVKGVSISEPLVVVPDPGDIQEDFDLICEIAIIKGGITLVVDEVDFYDSPTVQSKHFKHLIHGGRHYDVHLITTSRRPANISRDLTSQTEEFYIFKVHEKRDLDYFAALSPDLPDRIKGLPEHHFIKYDHIDVVQNAPVSF